MSIHKLQIDFIVNLSSFSLPAQLILLPFHQQCSFTFYEYHILSWIAPGASLRFLEHARPVIVQAAQQIYDRNLKVIVKHDFIFTEKK